MTPPSAGRASDHVALSGPRWLSRSLPVAARQISRVPTVLVSRVPCRGPEVAPDRASVRALRPARVWALLQRVGYGHQTRAAVWQGRHRVRESDSPGRARGAG